MGASARCPSGYADCALSRGMSNNIHITDITNKDSKADTSLRNPINATVFSLRRDKIKPELFADDTREETAYRMLLPPCVHRKPYPG
jgi:hypothetical protein